jgi:hypothetical protein
VREARHLGSDSYAAVAAQGAPLSPFVTVALTPDPYGTNVYDTLVQRNTSDPVFGEHFHLYAWAVSQFVIHFDRRID